MSPGLRPIGAYAPEGTTEETSARTFLFTYQGKLALENNLEELSSHFGETPFKPTLAKAHLDMINNYFYK
jgi:hypothetical protein